MPNVYRPSRVIHVEPSNEGNYGLLAPPEPEQVYGPKTRNYLEKSPGPLVLYGPNTRNNSIRNNINKLTIYKY